MPDVHDRPIATSRDARRAIYIDFEGRKDQPPALLGVLHGRSYRLFLLDPALAPLARCGPIADVSMRIATLDRAIAEVVRLAHAGPGERRVVAFSEHEQTLVRTYASEALAARVAEVYVNARATFKRWYNRMRPAERPVDEWTLEQCAAHAGYAWPEDEGFSPAEAIRRLREQLETATRSGKLPTSHTLALWKRLVAYNLHDCRATQQLMEFVAARSAEERRAQWLAESEARRARATERRARQRAWRSARGARPAVTSSSAGQSCCRRDRRPAR